MKNNTKLLVLAMLCIFAIGGVAAVASATVPTANVAQVISTKVAGSGVQTTQFIPSDVIYLDYKCSILPSNAAGTANITIVNLYSPGTVYGPVTVTGTGSLTVGHLPMGTYLVIVNGVNTIQIASGSFFVVPESVFGALAALGSGLAAFGIYTVKFKKAKNLI